MISDVPFTKVKFDVFEGFQAPSLIFILELPKSNFLVLAVAKLKYLQLTSFPLALNVPLLKLMESVTAKLFCKVQPPKPLVPPLKLALCKL